MGRQRIQAGPGQEGQDGGVPLRGVNEDVTLSVSRPP
jgi:hypothetical protein